MDPVFLELSKKVRDGLKTALRERGLFNPRIETVMKRHFVKAWASFCKLPITIAGCQRSKLNRCQFIMGLAQASFWVKLSKAKIIVEGLEIVRQDWNNIFAVAVINGKLPKVIPVELRSAVSSSAESGEEATSTLFFVAPWVE